MTGTTSALLNSTMHGMQLVQRGLSMTSSNITSATVEGYSRQKVEIFLDGDSRDAVLRRSYDEFLGREVGELTSTAGESSRYKTLTDQLQALVADPATSIGKSVDSFFAASNDLASQPHSIASRTAFLQEADNVASRIRTAAERMDFYAEQGFESLKDNVSKINELAKAIADINIKIRSSENTPGMDPPNMALDERERLVRELSGLVGTKSLTSKDGTFTVIMGKGQTLVQGAFANQLEISGDHQNPVIRITPPARSAAGTLGPEITATMTGGAIGADLKFLQHDIPENLDVLDALASGLSSGVNNVMTNGYDLQGAKGKPLFEISVASHPASSIRLALKDPAQVAAAASTDTDGKPAAGDNGAIASLLDLQDTRFIKISGNPDMTPADAYSYMASRLANAASIASTDSASRDQMLADATGRLMQSSGVNLDEEAANLMLYQQTYKAVAQLIPAMNAIFDTLLQAVR